MNSPTDPQPQPASQMGGSDGPPTGVGRGLSGDDDVPDDETHIGKLLLSMRAYNCLRRVGLTTVGHVRRKDRGELLAVRNFGRKAFEEVRDRFRELGIPTPNSWDAEDEAD